MSIESISSGNRTYQGSASVSESGKTPVVHATTGAEPNEQQNTAENVNISNAARNLQNVNTDRTNVTGMEEEKKSANAQIKSAVDNINKNSSSTEAIFGIHDGTNRVTIKIVDKDTKKVIKEYPPEKTLDMIEKVWEMAGLMIDEKR